MLIAFALIVDIRNRMCFLLDNQRYIVANTDLYHEELNKKYNINAVAFFFNDGAELSKQTILTNTTLQVPENAKKVCFDHQYPSGSTREAARAYRLIDLLFNIEEPATAPSLESNMEGQIGMLEKKAGAIESELEAQNAKLDRLSSKSNVLRANIAAFTLVSCLAYIALTYAFVRAMKQKLKSSRI